MAWLLISIQMAQMAPDPKIKVLDSSYNSVYPFQENLGPYLDLWLMCKLPQTGF